MTQRVTPGDPRSGHAEVTPRWPLESCRAPSPRPAAGRIP